MKKRFFSVLLAVLLVAGMVLPGQVKAQAAGGKLVALTFDDGPSGNTGRLLDGLAARGAKATSFTVGQQAESYKSTVKRIYMEGHQLCNHSYNHSNLTSLSLSNALNQVTKTDDLLNRITGGSEHYTLRAPYGNTNATIRAKLNCPVIYWSVDTRDWEHRNSTYVKNQIINNASDGAIILCHDLYSTTVDGALAAIDELQKKGYEFVTVRELFRRRGEEMKNGTVYYSCKPTGTDLGAIEAPQISVEAAAGGALVTLTTSSNVPVYYTTDGSSIGYGSTQYTGPFLVASGCTVRAVAAYHLNGGRSEEVTYKYTMPPTNKAQISVLNGMLSFSGIAADETVYYTLDGSDPSKSGIAYNGPVSVQPDSWIAFYTAAPNKVSTGVTYLYYSKLGNLFADVKPGAWYYDNIDAVAAMGYMNGVGDYKFDPNGRITRGMVVTILYRMSGSPGVEGRTNAFKDVKGTEYFATPVEWAYRNGIVAGMSPASFAPNRNITRQELAQMMVNYLRYMGMELPQNTSGAANGYGDRNKIAKWALASVETITKIGLMMGDEKGNFAPQNTATRAEGATVLYRMDCLFRGE